MSVPSPHETQQAGQFIFEAAAGSVLVTLGLVACEKLIVWGGNKFDRIRHKEAPSQNTWANDGRQAMLVARTAVTAPTYSEDEIFDQTVKQAEMVNSWMERDAEEAKAKGVIDPFMYVNDEERAFLLDHSGPAMASLLETLDKAAGIR